MYRPSEQAGCRILNSEIAHVHARSEGGPRWDPHMSAKENASVDNLIVMCQAHAKEIDDAPESYPADLLREWKRRQVQQCDAAAAAPAALNDAEAAEVINVSFGLDQMVEAVATVVPFSARSRTRGDALELAARQSLARRRIRLAPVPELRKDALLGWMAEHPPPAVVVPEGQVRVLVAPMGAGKSEQASRWWDEGLEVAADDEQVEIPVWLEARTLGSSLESVVTNAIGGDPWRPCRVVLDDLTWLPPATATRLLDEARQLVVVWPRMRILATCRPGLQIDQSERVDVAPWPTDHGAELIRQILQDEVPPGLWTREVDDLLTSPLLTLALAARLASGRSARVSPTRLLSEMAATIIDRERPQISAETWNLFALLAARVIATQAGIPVSALGVATPQIWPLTDSGLVVADDNGLRFALPVFEQHFGAEALRKGIVAVEEAASAASFPLWRYAIAYTVTTSDRQAADAWMLKLARINPAAASWVLDETVRTASPARAWDAASTTWVPAPGRQDETDPAVRVGRWLRDALEAFLDGFGACRPQLARHHDGQLVQWGARLIGDGMILTEARNTVTPDLVPVALEPYESARADGWYRSTQFEVPAGDLGRWQWARDRIRHPLAPLLRQRRLPLPDGSPLEAERLWLLAQHIMRLQHHRRPPTVISAADLRNATDKMMERVNLSVRSTWMSGSVRLDSDDIRWIHARLDTITTDHLESPRPLPDRAGFGKWRWREYSPELTLTILTDVFRDALVGYRDLVDANFPQFGAALGRYSTLPLRVEGHVIMEDEGGPGDHDSLYYTLKPDPGASTATPRVDLTLASAPQSLRDEASAALFRHRRAAFYQPTDQLASLPTGLDQPATAIAYRWLIDDLTNVGWWTGPIPAYG
ncbi:hypothetical protein ACFHYQ_01450 [Sphaerimonospora cavernae]|uniref:HNH endonuclease n=1 Tax=Sphaerimonospora cavernae TaxID=1740611 RepID=A0ABV6TXM9_9ACTN